MPGAVPIVATGPLALELAGKVLSPSKVCAPERPASSVETSGSAKVRVAPAAIAARSKTARRVGSASCASWKTASEKKAGRPAAIQALPSQPRKRRLVDDPGLPARARHQPHPGAVDPVGDVQVPAGPGAGGAGGDDVAVAVGRAGRRRGQVAVEDGELHEPVEQPQRLVDGDMLLRLRREQVRQQEVGAGVGHGCLQNCEGDGCRRAPPDEGGELEDADVERVAGPEQRAPVGDLLGGGVGDAGRGGAQRPLDGRRRRGSRPRRPRSPRRAAPPARSSCRRRARASGGSSGSRDRRASRAVRHGCSTWPTENGRRPTPSGVKLSARYDSVADRLATPGRRASWPRSPSVGLADRQRRQRLVEHHDPRAGRRRRRPWRPRCRAGRAAAG